jgi:hypothetical protein
MPALRLASAQACLCLHWHLTIRWSPRRRQLLLEAMFTLLGTVARAEGIPTPEAGTIIDEFARFLLAPSVTLQLEALQHVRQRCSRPEHSTLVGGPGGIPTDLQPQLEIIKRLIPARLPREALLDVLIAVGLTNGCLNPSQENLLRKACITWGIAGGRYFSILAYREQLLEDQNQKEQAWWEAAHKRAQEETIVGLSGPATAWAYETLCLTPNASLPEVKRAYRRLAMLHHPDRYPIDTPAQRAASEKFQELQRAYEALRKLFP